MNSYPDIKPASGNDDGLLSNLVTARSRKARIIITAIIGIIVVISVGLLIRHSHFDISVVQFFNNYHHDTIGSITNAVYKYIGPIFAIIGTVVVTGIILALSRSLRVASTFAVTIAATWVSLAAVKLIVHRVRPDPSMLSFPFDPAQIDASYPSGHAAFITALVVTICLGVSAGKRWWVGILGALAIAIVAASLLVDGVHFPSDIIGSIIWGIVIAPLVRMVWVAMIDTMTRRHESRRA